MALNRFQEKKIYSKSYLAFSLKLKVFSCRSETLHNQEEMCCLMFFLTHELQRGLENKCYSNISITCQR